MKLLITIPCLYNSVVIKECLDSIVNLPDTDIICLDNGAEVDVQNLLAEYEEKYYNITVWKEPVNTYVNKPWNNFMNYFLVSTEYTHLMILNSDIILHKQFYDGMKRRLKLFPDEILIPVISTDKNSVNVRLDEQLLHFQRVDNGTPGVMILLNREQCAIVNPIPSEIKLWYGDEWTYTLLRGIGYSTVIPSNLIVFHHGSESVKRLPN